MYAAHPISGLAKRLILLLLSHKRYSQNRKSMYYWYCSISVGYDADHPQIIIRCGSGVCNLQPSGSRYSTHTSGFARSAVLSYFYLRQTSLGHILMYLYPKAEYWNYLNMRSTRYLYSYTHTQPTVFSKLIVNYHKFSLQTWSFSQLRA